MLSFRGLMKYLHQQYGKWIAPDILKYQLIDQLDENLIQKNLSGAKRKLWIMKQLSKLGDKWRTNLSTYAPYGLNKIDTNHTNDNMMLENISIVSRDLDCLNPKKWLLDNVLALHLIYQKTHFFKTWEKEIEIIPPTLTELIKHSSIDNIRNQLQELNLLSKSLVIIPVNNAEVNTEGSHWSILIWSINQDSFYHVDTMGKMNKRVATGIMETMLKVLNLDYRHHKISYYEFQQSNGYDCGLYVLKFAKDAMESTFTKSKGTLGKFEPKFAIINSEEFRKNIKMELITIKIPTMPTDDVFTEISIRKAQQ